MVKVLHVKAVNTNPVYGKKSVSGADLWLGYDIYFVGGMPPSPSDSTERITWFAYSTNTPAQGVTVRNESGTLQWTTQFGDNGPFGVVTTGQWYHVDVRYQPGTPVVTDFFVDDMDQGETSSITNTNLTNAIGLGVRSPDSWMTGFEYYLANPRVGTARDSVDVWFSNLEGSLGDVFDSTTLGSGQTFELIEDPTGSAPGGCAGVGIMQPPWRWIITELDSSPITILDRVARSRSIEYQLNTPATISGEVDSGNPEINITHTDGFPFLTEGDRFLYCLRRDYNGNSCNDAWQCRASGIILNLDDDATSDGSNTVFTAYDPWQKLYALPVVNPLDLSGTADVVYPSTPADQIILDLLNNAEVQYIGTSLTATHIDFGITAFYSGTIETLPAITHTFQKETPIGQCLDELCARGICDIVLTPIYDPINRPGFLAELNVYATAGTQRAEAIFAWDKPSRSVVNMSRGIDGTQRANKIRFHTGQGGTEGTSEVTNALSVARFGEYWTTQFMVDTDDPTDVANQVTELMSQVSEHRRTVSFDPAPERSPVPFLEYYLGDTVRVFSSKKFRAPQSGFQRVTGFTIELSDDALETVRDVRVYIPDESELIPQGFNQQQELNVNLAGGQAFSLANNTTYRLGRPQA